MSIAEIIITASLLLLLTLGISSGIKSSIENEQGKLMKQCMDDGKKEYECVSMLRRGRQ